MRLPIDLHESSLTKFAPPLGADGQTEDEPELMALTATIREARLAAEAVVIAAKVIRADRSLTPAMADVRIRELALRRSEPVVAKLDAQRGRAVAAIKAFNQLTAAPQPPTDSVALQIESEIRANLKSMGDDKRKAVVGKAFGTGDMAIIGAVLRGPSFLSGYSDAEFEMTRHRYRKEFFGKELDRFSRLQKAIEATDRAGARFVRFLVEAADSEAARIAANAKAAADNIEAAQGAGQ